MYNHHAIESVAAALYAATLRDLPDIHYVDRDWEEYRKLSKEEQDIISTDEAKGATRRLLGPVVHKIRRPTEQECEVTMFPQTWASTALGYGGLGGAAMTTAYTVIVRCLDRNAYAVYFGSTGRLAYLVTERARFADVEAAIARRCMPSIADARRDRWFDDATEAATA